MAGFCYSFVLSDNKLSSHMAQISEEIHSTNKNHSYDHKRKMILNLGSKKDENNDNHSNQLSRQHNSL